MQVYKISMFFNGRSTWAMPSPPLFPYCMGRQGSSVSAQTGEKESPHPPHLQIVSDVQNTTYLCQSSSCSLRNEENYSSLTLCCTDHCVLACTCVRTSLSSISMGLYFALKWNTPQSLKKKICHFHNYRPLTCLSTLFWRLSITRPSIDLSFFHHLIHLFVQR